MIKDESLSAALGQVFQRTGGQAHRWCEVDCDPDVLQQLVEKGLVHRSPMGGGFVGITPSGVQRYTSLSGQQPSPGPKVPQVQKVEAQKVQALPPTQPRTGLESPATAEDLEPLLDQLREALAAGRIGSGARLQLARQLRALLLATR